jgi:hypothetical protein
MINEMSILLGDTWRKRGVGVISYTERNPSMSEKKLECPLREDVAG